jgi:hypothetical protein
LDRASMWAVWCRRRWRGDAHGCCQGGQASEHQVFQNPCEAQHNTGAQHHHKAQQAFTWPAWRGLSTLTQHDMVTRLYPRQLIGAVGSHRRCPPLYQTLPAYCRRATMNTLQPSPSRNHERSARSAVKSRHILLWRMAALPNLAVA